MIRPHRGRAGHSGGVPPAARSVPWWGVLSSAAAPVLLIGGWTVAASRQRDSYDSVTDTISALAAHGAADRWLMTTALVGVGACHVVTALALRPAARPGRLVLAAGGVATLLVAVFPLPSGSGSSAAHTLVAGISFGALAGWPAVAATARPTTATSEQACGIASACSDVTADVGVTEHVGVTEDVGVTADVGVAADVGAEASADGDVPWGLRPVVAVAASSVLAGLVGWFTVSLTSGDRVGLTERLAAGAQALWPLVTVLSAVGAAGWGRPARGDLPVRDRASGPAAE